ncbi:UTRA domain-containing protein [Stakelama tenebrarum]|uniref:UTRA domain-containing protein n=1 Tax=Stakelama tenebrarum TaxID=2711215 RepID=A0A6G6Y2E1_9SPHN|nr:UTRA domain-containing protein [Sphingosinithalassobacter tenebrarum]QIG78888.1 UTRA domain-containing protein [Sphingosinithalassobacter tenebrarum]
MPLSLHEQIRTDIERKILSGELLPGDHIPIEHELMRMYGCARMTVNKAISALAAAGLVERRKRFGTFVAKPRVHSLILDIPDLESEIIAREQAYRWELISRRIRKPKRNDAIEQDLARGEKLLEVKGIHYSDEKPLAFEFRVISLASVPEVADVALEEQPLSGWLLEHVPWTGVETRISAIGADRDTAETLGLTEGVPCLSLERRTWRGDDPITRLRQVFDGARYDLFARFQDDDARRRFVRYERQH